jgi:two-component system phosphate regulon sensor histidine kinase PhoR
MSWQRTLILYLIGVIGAALIQLNWQHPIGWIALALVGGGFLTWRRYQAAKVAQWAKAPTDRPAPTHVGPWSDVVRELSRYTQAQKELLAESQETTAAIMAAAQALPVGVVALDRVMHINWFNRAAEQQLGLSPETDTHKNLLDLIRQPEFARYARQRLWPEPIIQKTVQHHQEKLLMMQLVTYARDQRLLITRDLTQIDRLETTRRDFVANVSHELRTPLTVLAGFLETLHEAPEGAITSEQRNQYMDLMQEQAARMQSIVADLLTLSDLETNPNAEQAPVDVTALLGSAREQVEALSNARHTFEWDIDPALQLIGASQELASAFSNLLTNAVRYTPEKGTISVRWQRQADGTACYSVKDSGIGIAPEHIPRLTERFYRVDRGRSRAVGGTGLGLAITKHIAMRHSAQLNIESRLGKGSTFSLVFPVERVAPTT